MSMGTGCGVREHVTTVLLNRELRSFQHILILAALTTWLLAHQKNLYGCAKKKKYSTNLTDQTEPKQTALYIELAVRLSTYVRR